MLLHIHVLLYDCFACVLGEHARIAGSTFRAMTMVRAMPWLTINPLNNLARIML